MEEVALRDQHQPVTGARELAERLGDPVEQLDGVTHQLLAHRDDALDGGAVDAVPRQRQGRLDHREGEALDPVAEDGEVAPLGGHQRRVDRLRVDPGLEQGDVALLGDVEVALAVPEGVVRVHADELDGHEASLGDRGGGPAAPPHGR
jgi:hypothetical protein